MNLKISWIRDLSRFRMNHALLYSIFLLAESFICNDSLSFNPNWPFLWHISADLTPLRHDNLRLSDVSGISNS